MRHPSLLLIACLLLWLTACDNQDDTTPPQPVYAPQPAAIPQQLVYRFAVHPLHNPEMLQQAYQPLIDYLNQHLPQAHFELEASRDYQAYEAKFRRREPAFLLPNPWQTLQAQQVGYHVIATAGDASDFKGIFIVRKDSPIKIPADLKGKAVSYPSFTALAACIMPQYYLHTHGINVTKEIENRYVGSQESSIMNVYLNQVSAGATWPPPWRMFAKAHPTEAAELKVIWETEPLINNSVMARDDVPVELVENVRALLLSLKNVPEGKAITDSMQTDAFYPANDASYDVVKSYIARFEQQVRPVEQP